MDDTSQKNKKQLIYIFSFIVLIVGVLSASFAAYLFQKSQPQEVYDDVHYHAGFQIYVDGELRDYSSLEYMNFTNCSPDEEDHRNLEDPKERIHLHNGIGEVVHVHADNVTWRELFESLEITDLLDREEQAYYSTLSGWNPELLDAVPAEYESVVFTFGSEVEEETIVANIVTKEAITEAETGVESCGK